MPCMNAVFALDVATLYGRLIARWRHGRWYHRRGKGHYFYPTRVATGSLLVNTKKQQRLEMDKRKRRASLTHLRLKRSQWVNVCDIRVFRELESSVQVSCGVVKLNTDRGEVVRNRDCRCQTAQLLTRYRITENMIHTRRRISLTHGK